MSDSAEDLARQLATDSNLPFLQVIFDDMAPEIGNVYLTSPAMSLSSELSLGELKETFHSLGLPVKSAVTSKAINSAASSAYHDWQRANLGSIRVTDLDLFRLQPDTRKVTEIIELKRSFYSLEKWRPFAQDFVNFDLIEVLGNLNNIPFTIAYNVRSKSPFFDDPSQLSLFSYKSGVGATQLGVVTFASFCEQIFGDRVSVGS